VSRSSRRIEGRYRPNPRDTNATKVAIDHIVREEEKRSQMMVQALRAIDAAAISTESLVHLADASNRRIGGAR
jgi:hypothetical protein